MNEIKKLKEKQEELKKEIEKLGTRIKELEEQEKKCKRWRASRNGKYWHITPSASAIVNYTIEINDDQDNRSYETGNYFRTEEEAKKMVEKIKIYTQLKDLALRLNKGREVNWDDYKQAKWHIYYDHNNDLTTIGNYSYQDLGQIYCLDKNFLEIAKQEIGEKNLKKLFK